MNYSYEDYAVMVKQGAEVLDTRYPDWQHQIDLQSLRLHDAQLCVLGQLGQVHGRYYEEEIDFLGIPHDGEQHGFDLPPDEASKDAWRMLDELWTKQIEARRE